MVLEDYFVVKNSCVVLRHSTSGIRITNIQRIRKNLCVDNTDQIYIKNPPIVVCDYFMIFSVFPIKMLILLI